MIWFVGMICFDLVDVDAFLSGSIPQMYDAFLDEYDKLLLSFL